MKGGESAERRSLILCQDGSPFVPYYPVGINPDRCSGCGECVEVCPQGCIELKDMGGRQVAVISDMASCIGDGMCKLVCPENAFM